MLSDHEEKPEGAPEWMVSYADMITILMSFFVVMFSIASGESNNGKRSKQQEIAIESLQYRFGPKWKPFTSWSIMPGNSYLPGGGKGLGSPAPVQAVGDPGGTLLIKKKERARIRVQGQGDTIAIGGLVRFQPSTAKLAADQDDAIERITEELRGKPQIVEIVATASRRPLVPSGAPVPPGSTYRDRWELGYARCRAVAKILTDASIEADRFRLSVVPGDNAEAGSEKNAEADDAVRVNLSATLPSSGKSG
jgi:chemotaxis protein MotB